MSSSGAGATAPATRTFFTFDPALLLADISNVALDVFADGMDALERRVVEDLATAGFDMAVIGAIQEGLERVFDHVTANLDQAMVSFERLAVVTSLSVPPELFVEQAPPSASPPADPSEEAALDAELVALRAEATQVRSECLAMRQQLRAVESDLAEAGDGGRWRPLGDLLANGKASLLEDMGAIGAAAAKLPPLLARAASLRPCEGQRGRGGGGGASAAACGGENAPDAGAAEARVRRLMGAAGVGLEELWALNATLAQ